MGDMVVGREEGHVFRRGELAWLARRVRMLWFSPAIRLCACQTAQTGFISRYLRFNICYSRDPAEAHTRMSRKAPTPIRITPSSAPLEAMVAKQQSNIDELVTKNRSLEQTINKLKAELSSEKAKWEAAVQQLHQQHKDEQGEWREGCDSLQSLWRIAHLRAVVDLEKERMVAFKLKEELRLERLARLQRDFQIGQFQARETELEDRVQELALEVERKDGRRLEEVATLEATVEELRKEVEEQSGKLEEAVQARKQLEVRHCLLLSSVRYIAFRMLIALHSVPENPYKFACRACLPNSLVE